MASLCCPSTKAFRDRPNQPHDDKFTAFLDVYPNVITSEIVVDNTSDAFIIQVAQQTKDTQEPVQIRRFYCSYIEKSSPPVQSSPSDPRPTQTRGPPYRPPVLTQAEPMRRPLYSYGSGWTQQQRSSGSSGPPLPSRNSGPPPRKNSYGPPSWVAPDIADSMPNWRNTARPPSSASVSTASTSPTSSRNPMGRTQGSFTFPRGANSANGGMSRSPISPRAPGSVVSHSDRDTSGWETASNATNSTLQNRFALLQDGASTADESDNSEDFDHSHVAESVAAAVVQEDDLDYPSLTSGSLRKDGVLKVVEIGELQVKKSGMIRARNLKMFRCPVHDIVFELHVYVSEVDD